MAVLPFRGSFWSPADGATDLLLQEGVADLSVNDVGAGSASSPACRLAFCCGWGSTSRLPCVAFCSGLSVLPAIVDLAFRPMVWRPSGRIVFLFFLLAVWVVGGLLCVVEFMDWTSAVRGGVGLSHNGDADGRVHFPRISCGLSMFEVRSSLRRKEEAGWGLRFVLLRPDGRRHLERRRKTNSFASRGLVVIFFSFRVFPARKGCTVLSLFLI